MGRGRLAEVHLRERRDATTDEHHVGALVALDRFAGGRQVGPGREEQGARHGGESAIAAGDAERSRQSAAGRVAGHDRAGGINALRREQPFRRQQAVVNGGREAMLGCQAVGRREDAGACAIRERRGDRPVRFFRAEDVATAVEVQDRASVLDDAVFRQHPLPENRRIGHLGDARRGGPQVARPSRLSKGAADHRHPVGACTKASQLRADQAPTQEVDQCGLPAHLMSPGSGCAPRRRRGTAADPRGAGSRPNTTPGAAAAAGRVRWRRVPRGCAAGSTRCRAR